MTIEVETLTEEQEQAVMCWMSEEFLEERLGIPATPENVHRFVVYLALFENEVKQRKKQRFKKRQRCVEIV